MPKPVSRRKLRLAAAIALLLVGAGIFWFVRGDTKTSGGAEPQIVRVMRGNLEEVVTAQGKIEPKEYVDVGTQVSGQLKVLHVDIGYNVNKGDLLAEIDPRIYEAKVEAGSAQLKSLQAQLAEQEANLALARQQHARNEKLISSNAISKDAFDVSAATLKSAAARVGTQKAEIEQIESTLKGDKTNLEYTKIYAPMTGTVVTLPARVGQTLNANQTTPTLMQLANLDIMTIRAQVAEADVMRLKEGMPVRFTTLGAMEKQWQASVRQILPSPEVINDVVLYNVLIDVDNKDRQLMNGMSTQVFFEMGSARDVLVLPVEALGKRVQKEDGEGTLGYMVRRKGGDEVLVHVGLMDRTQAEIKDGVTEGEEILMSPRKQESQRPRQQGGGMGMGGPRL